MTLMNILFRLSTIIFFILHLSIISHSQDNVKSADKFLGMWTLDIEDETVGWLHVHNDQGYLDADMMWVGGSVVPVGHIYMANDKTLVVTRTFDRPIGKDAKGNDRKHTMAFIARMKRIGDRITGQMVGPDWNGGDERSTAFIGTSLPDVPNKPDLTNLNFGRPITLFNGRDLTGWRIINPKDKNGFMAQNGELITDPKQPESGEYVHYGNLRTEQEFTDFNLTLEVNVPVENNSGIYLKGMYEVQVYDSYGKDLDSHNMGALYSRITPTVNAEKPAGEWQTFDITLLDRHVTIILNGVTIIDNQPVYGPTGGAMISDVFAPGPIYLQGDHGNVKYRNIVIRPII